MNNAINVNYMTRTYSNFLKNNEAKGGKTESPSFCDRVAEKSTSATEAGKACLTAGQKTVFGSAGQSRKNGQRRR